MSSLELQEDDELTPLASKVKIPTDEEYKEILDDTVSKIKLWCLFYLLTNTLNLCRTYTFVLYAEELSSSSYNNISYILLTLYIFQGIGGITFGPLGDKYSFDYVMLPLSILVTICTLVEAFAVNFWMLSLGSILIHLFLGGYYSIIQAYIQKLLPRNLAIEWTSYAFMSREVGNILGPLIGGVLSYYFSFTVAYLFCTFISALQVILFYFFIFGDESKIKKRQLEMRLYYSNSDSIIDDNDKFPICVKNDSTLGDLKNAQLNGKLKILNFVLILPKLNLMEWIIIYNILLILGFLSGIEIIITRWYPLYIKNVYSNSIVISTTQGCLFSMFASLGYILVTKFTLGLEYVNNLTKSNKIYFLCKFSIGNALLFIVTTILISNWLFNLIKSGYNYYYIIYFYGFLYGLMYMSLLSVLLLIQPNKFTGLISGLKGIIANLNRGILTLIVGLLWTNVYFNSFWYVILIVIVLTLIDIILIYTTIKCNIININYIE